MNTDDNAYPELIHALLKPATYNHAVKDLQLIETHISWVILTGDFAYKIKKPVDLGFLDFSSLDKRRHCCEEELRLNRKMAASLYLDVIEITGNEHHPTLNGQGKAIEYAVKMRQFPQQAQFDNMLAVGELNMQHLDAAAHMISSFHLQTEATDTDSIYGKPEQVYHPVGENFRQIREQIRSAEYDRQLSDLEAWCKQKYERLLPTLNQRKRNGCIRECHGDMHLRNLAWHHNAPIAFDCLEFNPTLRWIDTMSDFAFLVMDLQSRQQGGMAQRLINIYLEHCGDYEGLLVLPFYLAYRALVRAKIAVIRAGQAGISQQKKQAAINEFASYLDLASHYTLANNPLLLITRGMSASGKSTITSKLITCPGMIRIRSDVERKRLFDTADRRTLQTDEAKCKAVINAGIYAAEASMQTYKRMAELTALVLEAGFTVIIDAAFLEYERRQVFQQLALKMRVSYLILEIVAPEKVLRRRIQERKQDVSDADLTVLSHQLQQWEPLCNEECKVAITIDSEKDIEISFLLEEIEHKAK